MKPIFRTKSGQARTSRFPLLLGLTLLGGILAAPAEARDTRAKAAVREVHVVTSGAFTAAFKALASRYRRETGVRIVTEHGPSMGDTPQAIPNRLARHEQADVYIQSTMLDRLGIADQVRPKGRMIPATPVGTIVANGEAELGFQQLSELKPVKGIRIVGLLPDALQQITPFSAGIVAYSTNQGEARALIAYLSSPRAFPIIRDSGLEPAAHKAKP